ncbi:MAG: hypothetical protein IPK82_43345 [Polyangiaceae bacterium]|nr:hypothetical protein [Polyangiaceae bacterium]
MGRSRDVARTEQNLPMGRLGTPLPVTLARVGGAKPSHVGTLCGGRAEPNQRSGGGRANMPITWSRADEST